MKTTNMFLSPLDIDRKDEAEFQSEAMTIWLAHGNENYFTKGKKKIAQNLRKILTYTSTMPGLGIYFLMHASCHVNFILS